MGRRRWAWAAAAGLLIAAVGGSVLAWVNGDTSSATSPKLAVTNVLAFDPFDTTGAGTENNGDLKLITDGDPTTSWRTERYPNADVEAYKGGVGLVATVGSVKELDQISIVTPAGGWSARIYVGEGSPPTTLEGWGQPATTVADVPSGTIKVPLRGQRGSAILIWFTRLAPLDQRFAAQVSGIAVRGS